MANGQNREGQIFDGKQSEERDLVKRVDKLVNHAIGTSERSSAHHERALLARHGRAKDWNAAAISDRRLAWLEQRRVGAFRSTGSPRSWRGEFDRTSGLTDVQSDERHAYGPNAWLTVD